MNTSNIKDYLFSLLKDILKDEDFDKLFPDEDFLQPLSDSITNENHDLYKYLPANLSKQELETIQTLQIILMGGQCPIMSDELTYQNRSDVANKLISMGEQVTTSDNMVAPHIYVLTLKGGIQMESGFFKVAYDTFVHALQLAKETNNYERQAVLYGNLCLVTNNPAEIYEYREKAIIAAQEANHVIRHIIALKDLAHALAQYREYFEERYQEARQFLQEAENLAEKEMVKNKWVVDVLAGVLCARASFESDEGNIVEARNNLEKARNYLPKLQNGRTIIDFYTIQADIYRKTAQFRKAEASLVDGLAIGKQINDLEGFAALLKGWGDIGDARLSLRNTRDYNIIIQNDIITTVQDNNLIGDHASPRRIKDFLSTLTRVLLISGQLADQNHELERAKKFFAQCKTRLENLEAIL
jgi:tetratricopeptide (TPR) repeat protein